MLQPFLFWRSLQQQLELDIWFSRVFAYIHPWRLTWNIIMEVWKIIFLSKWVIYRFHVNLPGCIGFTQTHRCKTCIYIYTHKCMLLHDPTKPCLSPTELAFIYEFPKKTFDFVVVSKKVGYPSKSTRDIYIYQHIPPIYGWYNGCIGQHEVIFGEQLPGYLPKGTQRSPCVPLKKAYMNIWLFGTIQCITFISG